jgi:signal peptidase II
MRWLKGQQDNSQHVSKQDFIAQRKVVLPNVTSHLIFWSFFGLGLLLDLWTKKAAFDWLKSRQANGVSIIRGLVSFVIALNDGAAFGIATGHANLLVVISIFALVVIFVVFFFSGTRQKIVHVALGLFAAGVSGNLWDRIFNDGFVRDFIDITYWPGRHWPAFNLADAMLCIGVALLVFSNFFIGRSSRKHAQQHK